MGSRHGAISITGREALTSSRTSRSTAASVWLPQQVNISSNDSAVTVKFDVAQPELKIDRYRVLLYVRGAKWAHNDVYHNSSNVVQPTKGGPYFGWTEFTDLHPGNYCLKILAKPTRSPVCHTDGGIVNSCRITRCHNFSVSLADTRPSKDTITGVSSTFMPMPTYTPSTGLHTVAGTATATQQRNTVGWYLGITLAMVVCVVVLLCLYIKRIKKKRRIDIGSNDQLEETPNNMNNRTLRTESSCRQQCNPRQQSLNDVGLPQEPSWQASMGTVEGPASHSTDTSKAQHEKAWQGICPNQANQWPLLRSHFPDAGFPQSPWAGEMSGEVDDANMRQPESVRMTKDPKLNREGVPNHAKGVDGTHGNTACTPRYQGTGLHRISHTNWSEAISGDVGQTSCGGVSGVFHSHGVSSVKSRSKLDLYELLAPSRSSIASSQFTEIWNAFNSIQPADVSTSNSQSSSRLLKQDLLVRSCPSLMEALSIQSTGSSCGPSDMTDADYSDNTVVLGAPNLTTEI
ncbi:uncharacterized protein LOC119741059 [Patiria miniata]|uniref:ILCR1 Ig-like domain-containing protein n=1 Tax=Patiria miniata TaxID=46514 RepID=A0A914B9G4_PATMI|nr:uncharacterized protein LOC119741059 [Patiria miniata]